MRVAIISSGFFPVIDGVTVAVWQRLEYLSSQQHQVLLLCPDYSYLANIYPNWADFIGEILPSVQVVSLPSSPFMGLDFESNVNRKAYTVVLEELAKFQPELVHVDEPERLWLGFFCRAGIDYAQKYSLPCVCFFHTNFLEYLEDYLPLPNFWVVFLQTIMRYHRNWIYNAYNLTLVSSQATAKKVRQLGFRNVEIADLLGVDLGKYQSVHKRDSYFREKYQIHGLEDKIKLVFLGRLTPDKGWSFTLATLQKFSQEIDWQNIAFIIAGAGTMQAEISEQMQQLNPQLYFLGRIPPAEVPDLLVNSDIYVTTSTKETRGLTVLEALAAGLAVLAPRAGGIVDTVQEGDNGLLFTPGDSQEFVEKLNLLCRDASLRARLGVKGQKSMTGLSLETVGTNLVRLWQEQISNYR